MPLTFSLLEQVAPAAGAGAATRYQAALERCVRADRLGYEAVWLIGTAGSWREPLVVASAVAGLTTRLGIGVAAPATTPDWPDATAEQLGALDLLAGGRLHLGVLDAADRAGPAEAATRGLVLLAPLAGSARQLLEIVREYESARAPGARAAAPANGVGFICRTLVADTDAEAGRLAAPGLGFTGGGKSTPRPLERALIGSPESITARLAGLQDELGDAHLVLEVEFGDLTAEQALATLERFDRELLPLFSPQPMLPPPWV